VGQCVVVAFEDVDGPDGRFALVRWMPVTDEARP
jgi:hypothetical protein